MLILGCHDCDEVVFGFQEFAFSTLNFSSFIIFLWFGLISISLSRAFLFILGCHDCDGLIALCLVPGNLPCLDFFPFMIGSPIPFLKLFSSGFPLNSDSFIKSFFFLFGFESLS
ncbi:unnamed protein product [Camellia sinensis]